MPDLNSAAWPLLRSPGDLKPLRLVDGKELRTEDGERYPIIDGVICLLKESERGHDLGDEKFYDQNPFGLRDWSNPQEVEEGVEKEFKDLMGDVTKDALIVDVGCGTGRISNFLSLHGHQNVVSLDFSLPSVQMVAKNSRNLCVWGNNLALPFASDSFDLVISSGVIHHTPDPERALAECARIIKPGGRMYLKLRNIHGPYGYLFHTYGSALRLFESKRRLRFLSDLFGFKVYKMTRKIFYRRLPKRDDAVLRGKYENLFIKKLITFFNTRDVKKMVGKNQLEIEYGKKVGFTHRQHFYVLRKRAGGAATSG